MPDNASLPDLRRVLDAYSVLQVEHAASPGEIRGAYRTLAHHHHPDRLPTSSPAADRERATRRMAEVNAAYALIRNAPLRRHPISRGQTLDWADAQAALDDTVRRTRMRRRWERVGAMVAVAGLTVLAAVTLGPALMRLGFGYRTAGAVVLAIVACAWIARRSIDPLSAVDGLVAVLRLLVTR